MGDILIAPSAGPDDDGGADRSTKLIQFGRVAVDERLALHLYLVAGHRRFAFMWSVLGREMMGCLVLAEPDNDDAMANAREALGAVGASGVSSIVVGVAGDGVSLERAAEQLQLSPDIATVPCHCGDRDSVKQALCAVLRKMQAHRPAAPAVAHEGAVSVPVRVA